MLITFGSVCSQDTFVTQMLILNLSASRALASPQILIMNLLILSLFPQLIYGSYPYGDVICTLGVAI